MERHGGRFNAEGRSASVVADLAPDTRNPYDENAVSVWVAGIRVGFLPASTAEIYTRVLQDLEDQGHFLGVPGRLFTWGPDNDGDGVMDAYAGSVSIQLPPVDGITPHNEPPEEPYAVLPVGRQVQVLGEDKHMDVLGPYTSDAGRNLCVSLDVDERNIVTVHLDGARVGELSTTTSPQLVDVVRLVRTHGKIPVCRGILTGSPLKAEMVLQVARSHEITQAWQDAEVGAAPGKA